GGEGGGGRGGGGGLGGGGWFWRASRAAAPGEASRAGRSRSAGSWASAATGASGGPSTVTARPGPAFGGSTGCPLPSTYDRRSGSHSATSSVGSPSVLASTSRIQPR